LTDAQYVDLVERMSREGIAGGAVYDAIIATAAEVAGVDLLVTLNVSHFLRVWPAGASRIVSPLTAAPPP
jgi:hypothetical protein